MIASAIAGATSSITAGFFELGPSFVPPFEAAREAGAEIHLLLDRRALGNAAASRMLRARGVDVRLASRPNAYIHWKSAVLDDRHLLVGTGNLIETDAPQHPMERGREMSGTREWWVVARDVPALAEPLAQRIGAAWAGAPAWLAAGGEELAARASGLVGAPHPQVPPLDVDVDPGHLHLAVGGAAAHEQLLEAMARPQRRLQITVPYIFAGEQRVFRLLELMEPHRGLVQILLGEPPRPPDLRALQKFGFEVRVMNVARCTRGHAKGVVIDDSVIVGSANWSEPGMSVNDEAGLRIADPRVAEYFAGAFSRDWAVADPA